MFKSETETTDLWIIKWGTRMKCFEKYQMEIAKSKAMGSIERGGKLGTEEAMWIWIATCRWSVGMKITLVIFHQAVGPKRAEICFPAELSLYHPHSQAVLRRYNKHGLVEIFAGGMERGCQDYQLYLLRYLHTEYLHWIPVSTNTHSFEVRRRQTRQWQEPC